MQKTKTRKSTEIQSAAIYRCTCQETGEVFYLVASDSQSGTYHMVRFDNARLSWRCDCPAHKPCKHEKAVCEVVNARHRRERELAAAATIATSALPEMAHAGDVEQHVEDSLASGELSWVEQQQAIRDAMTPEQRRAHYVDNFNPCWAA